ncbi:PDDEXK nuclease domain-containing protein [Runella sp. MFBS21]|uniref:PDDEXK nuclease domain-containing protein n=1 Tax=Runella sp. MFBS21 TaxID=3034018 RepID=UPI0023F62A0A|nr:PDDEXK nuclease domain-containing protein [Runella sp. MFBS21]MDF7820183.1 PDDEXK nuclease domain-containing protein [Runella sp. MFBS21]
MKNHLPDDYSRLLEDLKAEIRTARLRAISAVNAELLKLYWKVGKVIISQQENQGWGAKVIAKLADDLRKEFQDMKGFSPRNLLYMKQYAALYELDQITQPPVAQLPWAHHVILMDKVKSLDERLFYMAKSIEHGWSRDMLSLQVKGGLFQRHGKAISNFEHRLPSPQSDLAQQFTKDPYLFDFLTLAEDYREKDLENALTEHITKFLLELGAGFAFVGKQYHLEVGEQDFYLDLLFYHLKLRCYVVIELKRGKFQPEFAGKLNFYLSVVDDQLKTDVDQPSIGLLICQDKNKVIAEYALKDIHKPIGISEYQLTEIIPTNLEGNLPTIESLEIELQRPGRINRKR